MLKNIVFFVSFYSFVCSLYASHYMGLDVYYDYLGNNQYRIIIKAYGDCASTLGVDGLPNAGGLDFQLIGQGGGCTQPVQIGSWQLLSYQEVTPICPGYPTKCNTSGASLDGVREAVFQGIFDFTNVNCTRYNIRVSNCCRNNAITNVTSPGSRYIYSDVTTIDLSNPNSSPRFTQLPTPYICYNQPFSFNQGAVDPDGDSLVYRIDFCQGGTSAGTAGAPVVYIPPATNTAPVISNPPMSINPNTGDIFITPSAIQTAIMCVFVDEYRNGVLIGTIERDIQIKVINCGANRVPQLTGITDNPNFPTYQFTDTICAGVPATLYITSQDSNIGQFLTLTWNNGIPAASFSSTPGVNAFGTLTWNNPIASTQPYTFIVRVQDDYCPINGYRDYTFLLYVQGGPFTAHDSIVNIDCNDVTFAAILDSGGVAPFTYEWAGDGNLDFNIFRFDSTFTHSYPGPGTYHYTLTITDALGCKEIISDSVTIINAAFAYAGNDTTICNNTPLILGSPGSPHYTYRWRPGTFLSDSTVAQPTLTYLNTNPNSVVVTYQVIATDTLTGCSATDFVDITVKPEITTFIAGPSTICLGDSATLAAPLSASYLWSTGDTTQFIKVAPTDTTIYTLITTDFDGCPTNSDTLILNVIPPIQAEITGIDTICAGDSVLLTCTPASTYLWSTGATTQSIWVKPNVTTSYWVNTTHAGCAGLADTFTVVVNPIPTIDIQKNKLIACQQEIVSFYYIGNASNQALYTWSVTNGAILTGQGTDTITVAFDSTGTQFVYLTLNDKGCIVRDTQQIFINPIPIVSAGLDTTICKGTSVYVLQGQILSGTNCQYFWSPSYGLDNPNALNPNAFPDSTTTYYFYAVCNNCTSAIDSITVFVNPRPVAQILNPILQLCSGDTAQFQVNVTNGTGSYTYQWIPATGLSNPNIANPLVFPTSTTSYQLVVTDAVGCKSDTMLAQVTIHSSPILDAGENDTLCKGQGTFLQPTVAGMGSFTYQWSPSIGLSNPNIANPFVIPIQTTTYYLQVTSNLTGCVSNIDSVTIVVIDLQSQSAGEDAVICVGDSVQIGSSPVPGRQYFWSPTTGLSNPNISNPIASPSFTTTYTLQYIENGCISSSDEVTVTVIGRPTIDAGDSVETCPGEPVQLQAQASGVPGPFIYTWYPVSGLDNPNVQNPIASPLVTTKYYVYASAQGCEGNVDSVIVFVKPAPIVDADTTDSQYHICQGDTVYLPGKVSSLVQPVHIRWWGKNTNHTQWLSDTTIANPFVVPQASGTYYLQAFAGDCYSNIDSVYIRVTPKLDIKKFPDEAIVCKGTQIPIAVGNIPAGATVMWLNPLDSSLISNDSILFINPETNTTYLIYIVHEVCEYWDSIKVTVYPQPKARFRAGYNESCNQLEVSFSDISEHAVAWMWDFGDGTSVVNLQHPTHVYTQPGTYTVTLRIKGYGGCKDSSVYQQTFTVKEGVTAKFTSEPNSPVTMILPQTYVQFIDSSKNAVAWLWDFGDGYTSVEQNPVHQYLTIGQYFVNLQVIDTNGCVDAYAKGPYIVIEPSVQVYNVFTPNGDGINDYFRIPYDGHASYELIVYDRWGMRMYSTTNPQDKGWNGITPDGKEAVEGVYFYSLKIGDNLQNGSFTLLR